MGSSRLTARVHGELFFRLNPSAVVTAITTAQFPAWLGLR